MPTTMQAAVITAYRQATPTLQRVPLPTLRPNDVLVQIVAASINPLDLKIKDGGMKLLLPYKMPLILGNDFAGVITAVGSAVHGFAIGDAVYGRAPKDRIGTFAEYLAVDEAAIAVKPRNLSFAEAAALPLVALTSYQALHDVMHLQPGQKVFIPGGAGGIGTVAIQLAKQAGAVVATTASTSHTDLVRALGADLVIDYHDTAFTDVLSGYDAVFDTRGGRDLEQAFSIVRPGGHVVSIDGMPTAQFGREYGAAWWKRLLFAAAASPFTRRAKRTGVHYHFLFMRPSGPQLTRLTALVEAGQLHPVIDRVVPLAEIGAAFAHSAAGHATGKIVIQITEEPAHA